MQFVKVVTVIAAFIVMTWAFLVLGESMVGPTLHTDEGNYIGQSWSYHEFFNRDFPLWDSLGAFDQPALGAHLYGWWLKKESGGDSTFFSGFCDHFPVCYLGEPGAVDNLYLIYSDGGILQQTVLKTRVLSFLATWLLMGLLLLISQIIFDRLSLGIVWVILLLSNRTFVFEMTRAKTDSFLLLALVSLILLFAFWLKHKAGFEKKIGPFVPCLFGISIGLATLIKLNGFIGFFLLLGITLRLVGEKRMKIMAGIKLLTTTLLTAWIVFILLNPYTWKDPIKKTVLFVEQRQEVTKRYEKELYQSYLGDHWERFPKVSRSLIWRRGGVHGMNGLLNFISENRYLPLGIAILSLTFFLIDMIRKNKPYYQRGIYQMLLVIAVINYTYLSIDFPRYYLPLMLSLSFAISAFFVKVTDRVIWIFGKSRLIIRKLLLTIK